MYYGVSTSMCSALHLWTLNSKGNVFLPWVVHICNMVTLAGKGNVLEPENHISTLMSSALDLSPFEPKFDRELLFPMGSSYV
jgi:hypothetical protein